MKRLLLILFLAFLAVNLSAKDSKAKKEAKPSGGGSWSGYQGVMTWNDADAKCKSLGMRLPTAEELKSAYASGVTESWLNDGDSDDYWLVSDGGFGYWSSSSGGSGYTYFKLSITDGLILYGGINWNFKVRCRR
jgi:hypothetical protein